MRNSGINPPPPPQMGAFPPPPMGAFPPPPPPPNMGGFPPPPFPPPPYGAPMGFPQNPNAQVEYDENGNPILVEYVEEFVEEVVDDENSELDDGEEYVNVHDDFLPPPVPFENQNVEPSQIGRSISMDNSVLREIQESGAEKAIANIKNENRSRMFSFLMKFFVFIMLIAGAFAGVYEAYKIFFPKRSMEEVLEANRVREEKVLWRLEGGKANDILKTFYEKSGGFDSAGGVYDKIVSASMRIGIRVDPVFFIEKALRAYIKVGDPANKFYLINVAELKGESLENASVFSKSEPLPNSILLAFCGFTFFDEEIHREAFSNINMDKAPFVYSGVVEINSVMYDVVEYKSKRGFTYTYYFNTQTNLLGIKTIELGDVKMRVEFEDYAKFDEVLYPKVRKVFLNNTHYGTLNVDTISTNRDVMFPR